MYEVTLFRRATNKPDERGREYLKIPIKSWDYASLNNRLGRLIIELTNDLEPGQSLTISKK